MISNYPDAYVMANTIMNYVIKTASMFYTVRPVKICTANITKMFSEFGG